MMLLSRFWYLILALLLGVSIYVVYVAVGQYNRGNRVAMSEGLAADSQTVRWWMQIDARRRLDALLGGSVDKGIQDALVAANGKDKVPPRSREDARKALDGVLGKIPADFKPDAIFAVDREGRVVAQMGFDQANTFEDFELGGYPAVYDALHGYLRDDTWVLGGRIYRVVARPVEYDVAQPPAGAIVGLRVTDAAFAKKVSEATRANITFYANGTRVSSAAGTEGFDDKLLEQVTTELPKVEADKGFKDSGRTSFWSLANDKAGAVFSRFDGDAFELRAGYAVVRSRVSIPGPMGFLSGADDKDKQAVSWPSIIAVVLLGSLLGILFSFIEHSLPLKEFGKQAGRLRKGEIDLLQLARFRGPYRPIATDLNFGIERVAEKGGGAPRKQADLDAIIGPVPVQPAMSAFSFPQPGDASFQGGSSPPSSARVTGPNPARVTGPTGPNPARVTGGGPPPPPPRPPGPPPASTGAPPAASPSSAGANGPAAPPGPRPPPPPAAFAREAPSKPNVAPAPPPSSAAAVLAPATAPVDLVPAGEDETTKVANVSREVMEQAAGAAAAARLQGDETTEWMSVYEDFVRTKKQCNEATDGLTFEKFQHTLKKNRDALIQRHGCKRVRFSVYVKEGRASLKATPVKE